MQIEWVMGNWYSKLSRREGNCKSNIPSSRHPERTTAKRAGEKDPVKHVSRSDSAVDDPAHLI